MKKEFLLVKINLILIKLKVVKVDHIKLNQINKVFFKLFKNPTNNK
jgi:hypothetical protein